MSVYFENRTRSQAQSNFADCGSPESETNMDYPSNWESMSQDQKQEWRKVNDPEGFAAIARVSTIKGQIDSEIMFQLLMLRQGYCPITEQTYLRLLEKRLQYK